MADTRELEEREWQDPANWRLLVVYVARRDPRVIVPKRFGHGVGYTLNFGRPLGWCVLLPLVLSLGAVAFAVIRDVRHR